MKWSSSLAIMLLLLVGWTICDPEAVFDFITALQRQFRRSVTQRYGKRAVEELERKLKTEARRMNIPEEIATDVIAEHKEEIIARLGNQYVRDLLDD